MEAVQKWGRNYTTIVPSFVNIPGLFVSIFRYQLPVDSQLIVHPTEMTGRLLLLDLLFLQQELQGFSLPPPQEEGGESSGLKWLNLYMV